MRIFTLGYQNLNSDEYVQSLVNAGVGIVLDVRERAWSQRPAFLKSKLQRALKEANIEYLHVKEAGNPSINRKTARNAEECLTRYRDYLNNHPGCLDSLLVSIRTAAASGRPACLTCYERRHQECHRSVLVSELLTREISLHPIHLEPTLRVVSTKRVRQFETSSLRATSFVSPMLLPFS